MPKFVDDLHVAGALQASADPAKVTNTMQKAVGQSVDMEQYLDTDGTTVKAKVDANFIATYQALVAAGLTGATSAARYVGATTSGAPASGTFVTGDWVISKADGKVYVCTAGGTPGTWTTPSAASGPTLPLSRYLNLTTDSNNQVTLTKGTEYSFPFWIPGSGTLDRVGFKVGILSTDVGTVIRFGIRADSSGSPGSVSAETSVSVVTADGGTVGRKELTVSLACGQVYWFSICAQGSGVSNPGVTHAGTGLFGGAFFLGGLGSSRVSADWADGHGPVCATASNTSSTLAAGTTPTGPNTSQLGNNVPVFYVRRGT